MNKIEDLINKYEKLDKSEYIPPKEILSDLSTLKQDDKIEKYMRIPVIKVKDNGIKGTTPIHIVGTNVHDTLYIDSATKGIHYYNLQNGEGTNGDYEFVGIEDEYFPPQIEFIDFDDRIDKALEYIDNHFKNIKLLYYRYNNKYLISEIREDLQQILKGEK